jgi:hypothetical protein
VAAVMSLDERQANTSFVKGGEAREVLGLQAGMSNPLWA